MWPTNQKLLSLLSAPVDLLSSPFLYLQENFGKFKPFFHDRIYYFLAPHYKTLLSTWNFYQKTYTSSCQGHPVLMPSWSENYFTGVGLPDLTVPAGTERVLLPDYLLQSFAQFYFPKVRTLQYFQGKLWACSTQSLLCSVAAAFAFCTFVMVF